jgi:ribosomal protein S18 acetylase RimI-like enzyme
MCRHDGRSRYLQHVNVDEGHRGKGIAHDLVEYCLVKLRKVGIEKTHIDVFVENNLANRYWTRRGWQHRDDIYRYSMNRSSRANV